MVPCEALMRGMRRTVPIAIVIVIALVGCGRCDRIPYAGPPTMLVPAGPDASVCGTAKSPVSGAPHITASGRTFHVWTPSTYDGSRALPVVVAVHGMGSDGRGFQHWFKMETHVEDSAIVVYPDSQKTLWDIHGDTDLQFFDTMLDGLAAGYCIDRTRVFAVGFSYGGKMVHHLGCKRTSRFKAISVGDGSWADGAPSCAGRLPVLVTHRTRDDDELVAWGKDAATRWSKVNGCSTDTAPTDVEHGCVAWKDCAPGATVTFCEDRWFDPKWPHDWNHTIRPDYLTLTWHWLNAQP
jgi:polyhydroxybutyrate depolymerase